jgi:hypothetical protein
MKPPRQRAGGLIENHVLSIRSYTRREHEEVNAMLRKSGERLTPEQRASKQRSIDRISETMAPTERDQIVYRGIERGVYEKLRTGKTFTDRGFASASALPTTALKVINDSYGGFKPSGSGQMRQSGGQILEIKVPKGTRAISAGKGLSANAHELEVILDKGTTFKVLGTNKSGSVLRVEVVPKGKK